MTGEAPQLTLAHDMLSQSPIGVQDKVQDDKIRLSGFQHLAGYLK